MSTIFGEIRQLGFVVEDIEAAMHHWATVIGVGPWFYAPRIPVQNFQYRGQPSAMVLSVALANSGPLQVNSSSSATTSRRSTATSWPPESLVCSTWHTGRKTTTP